ncbi:AHH domain-containing protein [Corallococcus sicarius]|uniref:Uncharacterized protein n=1 Tax=Corallococcus sicarius TaxID=2316726 RepID=A0A3A8NC50_9BACT|nr:AHH domain-containing protein [Corallococcus sicarius]RKH41553.1 hypothetical protein D7X12_17945 [Corallococcus sicarius]
MADDGHIDGAGKLRARLKRSRDYRQKGYSHIDGDGGRKSAYLDLDVIRSVLLSRGTDAQGKVARGSREHASHYIFGHGRNFHIGQSPYSNQGHHLLPEEALSPNYLGSDQLRMLQGVDYDINNGENIIFLPSRSRDSDFHKLPHHSGSHPKYTKQIARDMGAVRKSLNAALAKDKKHKLWNPPTDIRDRLMGLQEQYWDFLVGAGPIAINTFKKPLPAKKKLGKRSK